MKTPTPQYVIHLLSGGLDSVVLLYDLLQHCKVHCLIFDYGQQHDQEIECARNVCHSLGVEYHLISLRDVFRDTSLVKGGKGSFIVPNRNMVFLSIAVSFAIQAKAQTVTIGCNADDTAMFPDCRPSFLDAVETAANLATQGDRIEICAPYIKSTKREIVALGHTLGVDLSATWSCYAGTPEPCGKCHACKTRNAAGA